MSNIFHNIPKLMKQQLFNKSQFRADLTISCNPMLAYKKCIQKASAQLDKYFWENFNMDVLVAARAWLIDQILQLAWEHFGWINSSDIALLAVGGYGRGELHPCSDIDLLILLKNDQYCLHQRKIECFLALVWDIGLNVGSSVRSLAESASQAEADLSIITSLMESRIVAGPHHLHNQLQHQIDSTHMWSSQRYLQAKFAEQRARHKKYKDTEYDLEPNIKGSPGGLRDLQMLGWVIRRHYGTHDLAELEKQGFLTNEERSELHNCRGFLWKVRWGLHSQTQRNENRLLFDHQRTLAEQFGYKNQTGSLAVEQFMQDYYRTVMTVSKLNELLLQHFDDDILNIDEPQKVTPLNERFQVRNNYIETVHPKVFTDHPPAILEMFVLITRYKYIRGATAETIRLLHDNQHLVNNKFRQDPRCTRLFLELMRAPYTLTATLRRLTRYGILGRYLPEFGQIIGQMQYDLFHTLTVDAHTILLIKYLRSFTYEKSRHQFPVAARIIQNIHKPELLYLAGLYHDIGKGRGGDHSQIGAVEAKKFCLIHGLDNEDTSLIIWLVRDHLIMSITAQKQDLSDPKVIQSFARRVKTRERLQYLYLLTVADLNATNPNLWNSWRASLLQQLLSQTLGLLKRGINNLPELNEQLTTTKEDALKILFSRGFEQNEAMQFWQHCNNEYFLRHHSEEIAWHTEGILRHKQKHDANSLIILIAKPSPIQEHQRSNIFVYATNQNNPFTATVTAFEQLGLAIQDAKIITSQTQFSLNTYTVLEADGSAIGCNHERIAQIKRHLNNTLKEPSILPQLIRRRTPRKLRHFSIEPVVILHSQIELRQTFVDITATDRPGLLALIGKTFSKLKLEVHSAKIATFGEKVEDRFAITTSGGEPVQNVEFCKKISHKLTTVLRKASLKDAIQPSSVMKHR